ncbi:phenylalanyl-tRNA synthetase [Cantharellus anzutake]|uniref:phenylalanyl-tRNA synthetase n=1 Tax=Cantharellus anzutake TaxID=1750568 RepID=UPI00190626F4|nr:phenylalanyl-tRNA synthetase [Cantharellus anzutake]KAF8341323.1 phenylalanyl-tRNA synthetase [Cantharellus anzutake]
MPTVAVDKADLFERLGTTYTTEEFDQLCFDFGVELDEDTTEEVKDNIKKGLPAERPQLKIEIPANRYDLLCIEGIARALRVFLQKSRAPTYKLVPPENGGLLTIYVKPETGRVRPYFAGAILRDIKFTPRSYASFIDLQDKLHQNIGRRRQLVAIGTHDLDTLTPPFRYEARPPQSIKFVPLNQQQEFTAENLMKHYENDKHLSKYLHIIRDSSVYPIIYDRTDTVLSMPPIINSEHSKITLGTRNIFIDVTATDETKLAIVVNMVALMFSEYCAEKFTVEPVRIVLPDGTERVAPDISSRKTAARISYINGVTGLSLPPARIIKLLNQMTLSATQSESSQDELGVEIPPTRPDILHECDIVEDAAIAYGFNNLTKTFPSTSTVAQPLGVSKLSDLIRNECAQAGWVEVLPLILCSHDENFAFLNHADDGKTAVKLANPKTTEYQVVRTTLIPGLLKTIRENRNHPLPIRVFESSDIVVKNPSVERQAQNIRKVGAVWCNKTAGFEVVHGLLDRIMTILEIPRILSTDKTSKHGYYIKEVDDAMFFPGRAATVCYRLNTSTPSPKSKVAVSKDALKSVVGTGDSQQDLEVGTLGILHPTVLQNFEIGYPCSSLELNLEPFKKDVVYVWEDEVNP